MIHLQDTMGQRHFRSIRASWWPFYYAAGWQDTGARDRKPRVDEDIWLVEFWGDKPVLPMLEAVE